MPSVPASAVASVREFHRFYTRQIGLLDEGLHASPFSLTEVRVLYELMHRATSTATAIGRDLGLDPGYLSRILAGFRRRSLLESGRAATDARRRLLRLTPKGERVLRPLEKAADRQAADMLAPLAPSDRERLVEAMHTIEKVLSPGAGREPGYRLRPPRPGDLGWVVHRHGVLYAAEYGWDERFEALVASIVEHFVEHLDPRRERCWIAERDGKIVGSVFLVRKSQRVAKLRLLYVEPDARGLGIGRRLVEECRRFAREAGYSKIVLWTQSVLTAARHIYRAAGFRLVARQRHTSFGHRLVAEIWECRLVCSAGARCATGAATFPDQAKD
ncbi:MAG TPA: helix-turn-helix domain-containing GNAT family N-acetyltransferase [Thermoanaerobaculia bacterium]|nr:helix-turn-helix domain-containing GNAT family N-acetyltransferase [Thermoanaerobaculia bacterium]